MVALPNLTVAHVEKLLPNATGVAFIGVGGQKRVFKATVDGCECALKFSDVPLGDTDSFDLEENSLDEFTARARREVQTMIECDSPHMVKLGPVDLTVVSWEYGHLLYFSEELIEGPTLQQILQGGNRLGPQEVGLLGMQIGKAICSLWALEKVHRDIKPANIMRRATNGEFVLLDAGLVFDKGGTSLSIGPVGTPYYFSPEQFDFANRRNSLDFRSDLFSLGVTMYQVLTGCHPFFDRGDSSQTVYNRIINEAAVPVSNHCDLPEALKEVIMRLLGKSPHLRYRHCHQLIDALAVIEY